MAFRRFSTKREQPSRSRWVLLRRLTIGPRLLLFMAVPSIALLLLIGLFATADVRSLNELRAFHDSSSVIDEFVDARAQLQAERHQAILGNANGEPVVFISDQGILDIADLMTDNSIEGGVELREDLETARQFAANNRFDQAVFAYNDIIDRLIIAVDDYLDDAPLGVALQRSEALRALLESEEAYLREDLEARSSSRSSTDLTRLHTSASEALGRYTDNASESGAAALEELTVGSSWRALTVIRAASFGDSSAPFDLERWGPHAEVRRLTFVVLARQESIELQTEIGNTVDSEVRRLGTLAAIVALVILVATFGALRLRKSIIGPLSNLTVNARLLSRGELAPIEDNANDEIAEVGNAFSSLSNTMEGLWTDVDAVSAAVGNRQYQRRLDVSELQGDWLRLATTMNDTLATGEAHRDSVNEELDRRGAMTEISNAAVMAETASEVTAAVLHHLPSALMGSHAHLHEHPSGPPSYDLGVPLEPSISALEVPTLTDHAQRVQLRKGSGVAALVEFPDGAPAVLVLRFGRTEPTNIEPLISLMETTGRILAQAHRRQAAETSENHIREHDILTGLPNSTHLQRWFAERSPAGTGAAKQWAALGVQPLRMGDWDDVFGRDAREVVLQEIASVLNETVAHSATELSAEVSVARIGEPEFLVIVPHAHYDALLTEITTAFSAPLIVQDSQINVDLNIGVDTVEDDDLDLTQTIANVSAAIRHGAGNEAGIVTFEPRHREEVRRRSELINWLANAIANRDLEVHFQPIVNAVTTTIEGYECLIRGTKDGKPISPAEFIPLAEETNMIVDIGQFVLREACQALPFLRGDSPYVAVNLSPIELSNPSLISDIESVLDEAAIERSRIVLEVTEGATTTDDDVELLKDIRALGVKIAIDDFGSGQSNLSYLNTLPAQILKLDRSLVTPMVDDPGAASVVRKAIEMAHDLDMTVVGEGVETNEELDALRRMRCDRIQGWFTGRPGPLENFIEITIDRPVTRIHSPKDAR